MTDHVNSSSLLVSPSYTNPTGLGWQDTLRKTGNRQIEIVLVMAGHQPFGVLMEQVLNIVRSGGEGAQVISQPNPAKNQVWGEIVYGSSGRLRVLELARMLQMPLVETLERSKILLSGRIDPQGRIQGQFGLGVDDILAVRAIGLEDLRTVPAWLCQKRLGKLVWGAALLDKAALVPQGGPNELQVENLLSPVALADFMAGAINLGPDTTAADQKPSLSLPYATGRASLPTETRRPVMMLDLNVLYPMAYPDGENV